MTGIMQRLRDETSELHQHAERRPLEQAMARGEISRETYVENLGQRYMIHRTLEAQVRALCADDPRLNGLLLEEQYQLPNLAADLEYFGVAIDTIDPTRGLLNLVDFLETQALEEPVGVLGTFYVFEGSKNGAHFLAPRVRASIGLNGENGTRYLDPHGQQQREVWMQFRARMDAIAFTPEECDAMVRGAKAAFSFVSDVDDDVYNRTIRHVSTPA